MYKKCNSKSIQRYIAKNYDRINLMVPKGTRDAYRTHAESQGMNLSAWIRSLIDADMQKTASED